MTRLGFVGLGIMGLPMARNLARRGEKLDVLGYNRSAGRRALFDQDGGRSVATPGELYRQCDCIFLSLPTNEQVERVVGEIIEHCPAGTLVVDTSSTSPALIQDLAARAREKGLFLLDAPVSGGESGAVAASLAIMCGGEREAFERARPYLARMGRTVTYMGPSGAGSVAKVVNNMIVGVHLAVLGEAFGLAKKAGLDLETLFEAIRTGYAGSTVMEIKAPRLLAGDYSPSGRLAVHQKDLQNARALAGRLGVEIPLSMTVLDYMDRLVADGHHDDDHCAVARIYEQAMGVTLGPAGGRKE